MKIGDILNLEAFPLDNLDGVLGQELIASCRRSLEDTGMFNLEGFIRPEALDASLEELVPLLEGASFTHKRCHNIYFKREVDGLPEGHPALQEVETVNHTVCADQFPENALITLYEWPAMADFLARVMGKEVLYPMADPLARTNVMAYHEGEALNWHFDRAEFTTTLMLQSPMGGGEFEYSTDLRSAENPNYDGVAKLLRGEDDNVRKLTLSAGTLNVFRGVNTAHRVTPVVGERPRIIAIFSYFEKPGVAFSDEERLGFYGRTC